MILWAKLLINFWWTFLINFWDLTSSRLRCQCFFLLHLTEIYRIFVFSLLHHPVPPQRPGESIWESEKITYLHLTLSLTSLWSFSIFCDDVASFDCLGRLTTISLVLESVVHHWHRFSSYTYRLSTMSWPAGLNSYVSWLTSDSMVYRIMTQVWLTSFPPIMHTSSNCVIAPSHIQCHSLINFLVVIWLC